MICIHKIGFCNGTKVFVEALNAGKLLGWLKKFELVQNISGPVKGQGISCLPQDAVPFLLKVDFWKWLCFAAAGQSCCQVVFLDKTV